MLGLSEISSSSSSHSNHRHEIRILDVFNGHRKVSVGFFIDCSTLPFNAQMCTVRTSYPDFESGTSDHDLPCYSFRIISDTRYTSDMNRNGTSHKPNDGTAGDNSICISCRYSGYQFARSLKSNLQIFFNRSSSRAALVFFLPTVFN